MKEIQSAGRKKDQKIKKEEGGRKAQESMKNVHETSPRCSLFIPLDLFLFFGNPAPFYSQWTEPDVSAKSSSHQDKSRLIMIALTFHLITNWTGKIKFMMQTLGLEVKPFNAQSCLLLWMTFAVGWSKASKMDKSLKQPLRTIKTNPFFLCIFKFPEAVQLLKCFLKAEDTGMGWSLSATLETSVNWFMCPHFFLLLSSAVWSCNRKKSLGKKIIRHNEHFSEPVHRWLSKKDMAPLQWNVTQEGHRKNVDSMGGSCRHILSEIIQTEEDWCSTTQLICGIRKKLRKRG